ncbi:protein argonaute MEL1-like isoform X2 [Phalaenopsis equestris]|uniref:protein argonaute MEL1-like isoform X2 n=1 Tax=Phalaenopsis equestris TaxID=78828 RepID=UPI0009E4AEEA|nr:protein argonaute MEL1-like isoform X2 [Phalaenopsis equestris]
MGLCLNTDISTTPFYKAGSLLDFVMEFFNIRSVPQTLSEKQRLEIQKALKGVRVETTHLVHVCRRYKITGFTSQPASQLMFTLDGPQGGTEISVAKYFEIKHFYEIKYDLLPCIKAGSDSKPNYLPMEVCNIVAGQRYIKKLNDLQVTRILKATCMRPVDREKSIFKLVDKNNYNKDKHVLNFGMKIDTHLTTAEARVLHPPKLKYNDRGRETDCEPKDGKWNMFNKKFVKGGTLNTWACISFCRHSMAVIQDFCRELALTCNNFGMVFNDIPVHFSSRPPSEIDKALYELHRQYVNAMPQLQLLIVFLPEAKGTYGKIKKICETELGIVTQCCQPKHLQSKPNKQYFVNLALKINVKVGGSNTYLEDVITKQVPLASNAPTIIFGADVTHPSPGEDSSSIAAVVASMDYFLVKYKCLLSAQPRRQEIIENLFKMTDNGPQGMIRELLLEFYRESNGHKPKHILLYRDGVSEGQFNNVLSNEMDAIKKACVSIEEDYLPPITFIVVQKRHHTRLFPENENMADRSGNILPGTVVDRNICHPTEFDFYLCSHAGIQGTSRPAHYRVLCDENGLSADQLQTLTNNLCYIYARCTRSVSVVAPVYYAHLAAFRARYYMEAGSEYGSSQISGRTRERATTISALPAVKENIRDVMFYC